MPNGKRVDVLYRPVTSITGLIEAIGRLDGFLSPRRLPVLVWADCALNTEPVTIRNPLVEGDPILAELEVLLEASHTGSLSVTTDFFVGDRP